MVSRWPITACARISAHFLWFAMVGRYRCNDNLYARAGHTVGHHRPTKCGKYDQSAARNAEDPSEFDRSTTNGQRQRNGSLQPGIDTTDVQRESESIEKYARTDGTGAHFPLIFHWHPSNGQCTSRIVVHGRYAVVHGSHNTRSILHAAIDNMRNVSADHSLGCGRHEPEYE